MKNLLTKLTGLFAAISVALFSSTAFAVVDPAIQTAFQEAGADAATVIGYVALALVVMIGALWVLKGIRSGR